MTLLIGKAYCTIINPCCSTSAVVSTVIKKTINCTWRNILEKLIAVLKIFISPAFDACPETAKQGSETLIEPCLAVWHSLLISTYKTRFKHIFCWHDFCINIIVCVDINCEYGRGIEQRMNRKPFWDWYLSTLFVNY